jgi:lisH domain-containing protein FOPNL
LIFNGYQHTLSVFLPESGQPQPSSIDRSFITKKLKIIEDKKSQGLPLLYGLTFGNKKPINE